MYQHINADYYGFRDEEDGVLEKVEAEAERKVRQKVSSTIDMVYSPMFARVCVNTSLERAQRQELGG